MDSNAREPLLALNDIVVCYGKKSPVVDTAGLVVYPGEVTGLVGESGSGKTTLGLVATGMLAPDAGDVFFAGARIRSHVRSDMQAHRRNVQMVFQDPASSLNPRMTVGDILDEVLYVHRKALEMPERRERELRRDALLDAVGLACNMGQRYPHALSGGQRQRVGIARALAVNPRLLVADEPVSALDVSVQVQILNLLKMVNETLGQACLFIAHDLAVVRYMCKRAYVMEKGCIVESGDCDALFRAP
ncbi:MAG: ATP-binding cassette domain-containing protein, partial [Kiritimatiellia bacterium]